jgi:hypothetical protein
MDRKGKLFEDHWLKGRIQIEGNTSPVFLGWRNPMNQSCWEQKDITFLCVGCELNFTTTVRM